MLGWVEGTSVDEGTGGWTSAEAAVGRSRVCTGTSASALYRVPVAGCIRSTLRYQTGEAPRASAAITGTVQKAIEQTALYAQ